MFELLGDNVRCPRDVFVMYTANEDEGILALKNYLHPVDLWMCELNARNVFLFNLISPADEKHPSARTELD